MSAWIVSKAHIDVLVWAALELLPKNHGPFRWYWDFNKRTGEPMKQRVLDYTNADDIGKMLWLECYKSVSRRYSHYKDDLPGPVGVSQEWMDNYTYTPTMRPIAGGIMHKAYTLVEIFKTIACYEYQSCEHHEWRWSEAYAYCQYLKDCLIHQLPGWDAAPWGIN